MSKTILAAIGAVALVLLVFAIVISNDGGGAIVKNPTGFEHMYIYPEDSPSARTLQEEGGEKKKSKKEKKKKDKKEKKSAKKKKKSKDRMLLVVEYVRSYWNPQMPQTLEKED
mmetsp:Transcript_4815/g.10219  ORF Transcript_4815/g.10219 Transcript_4815/m.10219 type:complete len:113 (-) Transcript_4815:118-456(-)|eukprot:CAMPEP_0178637564 /NCGR_PEP_ID=MMETSP0698-20121128/14393_1 /TAXON_ID=265572 /ORGANISM="Extubocellulus spinifer, Strain CCMP396" /LENGTH=112 /DNA_ID=CAMNT_0020277631 /DNA_START=68 /DNA_END=406 /DNA_ORIENTATION=+